MQTVAIERASELPAAVKSAVEQLLGRLINADEEISITAVPPQLVPPSANRAEVAERLQAFLEDREQKVRDTSDEDLDQAIDAAADQVRHNRSGRLFSTQTFLSAPMQKPEGQRENFFN